MVTRFARRSVFDHRQEKSESLQLFFKFSRFLNVLYKAKKTASREEAVFWFQLKCPVLEQFQDRIAIVGHLEGATVGGEDFLVDGKSQGSGDGGIEVSRKYAVRFDTLSTFI